LSSLHLRLQVLRIRNPHVPLWLPKTILGRSGQSSTGRAAALDWLQPLSRGPYSYVGITNPIFTERIMLWTLFVILLVLCLVGVVRSYALGGFIRLLLVLAVIALIFQLISGRRAVV